MAFYRPDAGEIRLRGQAVRFRSAHDAIRHGLGMVHQHFMLVPTLTVAENLMLGQPSPARAAARGSPSGGGAHHRTRAAPWPRGRSACTCRQPLGRPAAAGRDPQSALSGAEILILDEPTAVLTPQEVDELLAVLRGLAADGRSIVFISHKLDEVLRLADRIAVLRGRTAGRDRAGRLDRCSGSGAADGRPRARRCRRDPLGPTSASRG